MSVNDSIVVIGGGPAGASASALLARMGLDVVLLERECFPRAHVGESLLPGSIPILESLGVMDEVREAGFTVKPGRDDDLGYGERAMELVLQGGRTPAIRTPTRYGVLNSTLSS